MFKFISPRSVSLSVVAASCLVCSSLSAATLTLRQGNNGYTGTDDAMIIASSSTENWGGRNEFDAGTAAGGSVRRSLLRFDVSALSGLYTSVNSVTITLSTSLPIDGSTNLVNTVNMYSILSGNANWVEGTQISSDSLADNGMSTWSSLVQGSTPWAGSAGLSTAGTDYSPTILASVTSSAGASAGTVFTFIISDPLIATNLINSWLDGTNEGLLLRATDESNKGSGIASRISFASSEHGTANWRPQITIDYNAVPEPGRAMLALVGLVALVSRRRRSC